MCTVACAGQRFLRGFSLLPPLSHARERDAASVHQPGLRPILVLLSRGFSGDSSEKPTHCWEGHCFEAL